MRFIDLFAGMGGFHRALAEFGHECVFASELDTELRDLYRKNFPQMKERVFGDIRDPETKSAVPPHEILCAGFPCQPFSKSGGQLGTRDPTRGTLFHEILDVLKIHTPTYVILENVGNFARHDSGETWRIVREQLVSLGYTVAATLHKTPRAKFDWRDSGGTTKLDRPFASDLSGELGPGLISPHHFGFPHHRERFFIVASLRTLPDPPFPVRDTSTVVSFETIIQRTSELSSSDAIETRLSPDQKQCIRHWNRLLKSLPRDTALPSFPIWGDELQARYPYKERTPWATPTSELRTCFAPPFPKYTRKVDMMHALPSYARDEIDVFRHWKIRYIAQNRGWWESVQKTMPPGWETELRQMTPSFRKLEWNVKGGDRNLWRHVLQFRPSGLRAKRYVSSPALVSMTSTQIPILGPEKRFLTKVEGLLLQGFPPSHLLPKSRVMQFRALGNAVHVEVVKRIAVHLLGGSTTLGADKRHVIGGANVERIHDNGLTKSQR